MSWMIKIEDVSKMYRLGLVGSATLQDDFHLGDRGLVNVKDLRNAWIQLEY